MGQFLLGGWILLWFDGWMVDMYGRVGEPALWPCSSEGGRSLTDIASFLPETCTPATYPNLLGFLCVPCTTYYGVPDRGSCVVLGEHLDRVEQGRKPSGAGRTSLLLPSFTPDTYPTMCDSECH